MDECKIAEKLQLVHKWAHRSANALTPEQLAEAHELGERLIEFLDDSGKGNGIKLLAAIEVACVGADEMESLNESFEQEENEGTATVN